MTSATIQIGAHVRCTDAACGSLRRIVIDPAAQVMTYLAVGSGRDAGRLVPSRHIGSTVPEITLTCTRAEFDGFVSDHDFSVTPPAGPESRGDLGTLLWLQAADPGIIGRDSLIPETSPTVAAFDRVPAGEEQLQAQERVTGTDGLIGRVSGVAVDRVDHRVVELLVETGHRFARRQIAIPFSAVEHIGIGIRVGLTRAQIRALDQS